MENQYSYKNPGGISLSLMETSENFTEEDEDGSNPIPVDGRGFRKDHFVVPNHYYGDINTVLIPRGLILDRVQKLARDIFKKFQSQDFHVICILKGSRCFFQSLIHYLNECYSYRDASSKGPPYWEHYVRIRSYKNDAAVKNGGLDMVAFDDLSVIRNKQALIVEDIIDTGNTLTLFSRWLQEKYHPSNISVASLLEKEIESSNKFKGDFVGFRVPNYFLVGFSLDYNEKYRDLEHICVLNAVAIKESRVEE